MSGGTIPIVAETPRELATRMNIVEERYFVFASQTHHVVYRDRDGGEEHEWVAFVFHRGLRKESTPEPAKLGSGVLG